MQNTNDTIKHTNHALPDGALWPSSRVRAWKPRCLKRTEKMLWSAWGVVVVVVVVVVTNIIHAGSTIEILWSDGRSHVVKLQTEPFPDPQPEIPAYV